MPGEHPAHVRQRVACRDGSARATPQTADRAGCKVAARFRGDAPRPGLLDAEAAELRLVGEHPRHDLADRGSRRGRTCRARARPTHRPIRRAGSPSTCSSRSAQRARLAARRSTQPLVAQASISSAEASRGPTLGSYPGILISGPRRNVLPSGSSTGMPDGHDRGAQTRPRLEHAREPLPGVVAPEPRGGALEALEHGAAEVQLEEVLRELGRAEVAERDGRDRALAPRAAGCGRARSGARGRP